MLELGRTTVARTELLARRRLEEPVARRRAAEGRKKAAGERRRLVVRKRAEGLLRKPEREELRTKPLVL